MIVDAIFSLFESALNAVLGLIPEVAAPDLSGWVAGLAPIWEKAAWLNKYVPLDQAALILGVLAVAWLASYAVRVVLWGLTKLHVLGGE